MLVVQRTLLVSETLSNLWIKYRKPLSSGKFRAFLFCKVWGLGTLFTMKQKKMLCRRDNKPPKRWVSFIRQSTIVAELSVTGNMRPSSSVCPTESLQIQLHPYGSKIHQKENLHFDLYSIQNVLYEIEDDTFRTTPRSENQVTVSLGPCARKKEPRNSLCPRGYCSANACQDRNRSNSVKLSREAESFA